MVASIRGHQAVIKAFKNGVNVGLVTVTRFDVNQDSTFMRSNYVGQAIPEGDQDNQGWSGTMDLEVKGSEVDEMIDALVSQNLAGIGAEEVTIVDTENYGDGKVSSYVYFDVQFKMSKSQGGSTEKITKKLDWQASGRLPL